MRPRSLLFTLLFFPISTSLFSQVDTILNNLVTRHPVEKLYMHYDKDYYMAGETIWFKAYFNNDRMPSNLSSSFYLQFSDGKGNIVATKKYPIIGATAKGNIELPDTLPEGNYFITAASAGILSFGNDFIHNKTIYVFNPSKKVAGATVAKKPINLKFYPESGNLVDGILTIVAFQATDAWGNPADINGVVRTEDGTAICSFKTFHAGIGKTQFKPQVGKKYKAEVEYNGMVNTYELPAVVASGINLKVQDEKGGKMFLLARNGPAKAEYQNIYLMAEMNNRIVYETEIDFEDYPSVKGHLITDSLPSGVIHFTVFNKDKVPLAERLAFVNNREYMVQPQVEAVLSNLTRKGSNTFEIRFADTLQRSLSVAVTDAAIGQSDDKENIWSSFLLTNELKGHVYNPAYYFRSPDDSTNLALDNLMLTHGWSRFEWKKLLAKEYPAPTLTDNHFLSISGQVLDAQGKSPVSGGQLNIYLESEDSSTQNYDVPIAAEGKFILDSMIVNGSSKFYYAYTNSQGKIRTVEIKLDADKSDYASLFKDVRGRRWIMNEPKTANSQELYSWIASDKEKVKELERVVLQSKTSKKPVEIVNEKYTTGVFRAMGKVNIDNVTQPSGDKSGNVLDFIKNRIQQVELQGNRFVSRKNFSLMSGQKWAVDVMLDESPVNAAVLRSLRIDEVALVKYFEAGFVGAGSSSPGGLIAVYTKRSDVAEVKPDKLEFFSYKGYSISRQFYSPDYSKPGLLEFADKRTTLFWNPDLYTDSESNKVQVSFYNNDTAKRYRVVVAGFDLNGKLVYVEKVIE